MSHLVSDEEFAKIAVKFVVPHRLYFLELLRQSTRLERRARAALEADPGSVELKKQLADREHWRDTHRNNLKAMGFSLYEIALLTDGIGDCEKDNVIGS